MSRQAVITPQVASLGNVFSQAAEFGTEEVNNIRFAVESLDSRMFTGFDLNLLNEDRLPSAGTVQRLRVPDLTLERAQAYQQAAADFPSEEWETYVEAVILDFRRRLTAQALATASSALQKGQVDKALRG